jgi:hypothetical protein
VAEKGNDTLALRMELSGVHRQRIGVHVVLAVFVDRLERGDISVKRIWTSANAPSHGLSQTDSQRSKQPL